VCDGSDWPQSFEPCGDGTFGQLADELGGSNAAVSGLSDFPGYGVTLAQFLCPAAQVIPWGMTSVSGAAQISRSPRRLPAVPATAQDILASSGPADKTTRRRTGAAGLLHRPGGP
jgi:hypothetical protein